MARARSLLHSELIPLIRDVVGQGGHLAVQAAGGSMLPTISPGDVLVLGPAGKPQVGDIAVVARLGRVVAHRVVRTEGIALATRGDACTREDLPASEVLARVCAIRPRRVRRGWLEGVRRRLSALAEVNR
jgi:SOS-response transcriptional repressor LexA